MKHIYNFGKYLKFLGAIFKRPENLRMYWQELMRQMYIIGVQSVPIVIMVAAFIGAVTAVQFAYQMKNFAVPAYYLGFIVRDSSVIEMAPTITSLIMAGKAGSNMSSELGNMRITEQIEALEIMGIYTETYLVGTKIIAALCMLPLLVIMAALMGIGGGLVATLLGDLVSFADYERGLHAFFIPYNVTLMLIKSVAFAFILSSVSCFHGFYVKGGAIEIGSASTRAVVNSSILILIFDYIIAWLLL